MIDVNGGPFFLPSLVKYVFGAYSLQDCTETGINVCESFLAGPSTAAPAFTGIPSAEIGFCDSETIGGYTAPGLPFYYAGQGVVFTESADYYFAPRTGVYYS